VTYGWNLLGNPFLTDFPISNLRVKYKNGTTRSFEDALNDRHVAGYVWSWEASLSQYLFAAIHPERYNTSASKQTYIAPFRGFWLLSENSDVDTIILNQ
jgi:hypothetical protein